MVEGTNKRNVGMTIDELKDTFQYGMHGCGFYKGTNHVNSLEALRFWRKQGVKVMEIDIAKTHDDGFVALAHLMNKHYLNLVEIDIPEKTDNLTEEWFLEQKLCQRTTKGLSPMNLSMVVNLMREDPELFVMFDLWRMWREEDTFLFSNKLSSLYNESGLNNRCVIEVYNRDMINGIRKADKGLNIMYCVHAPKEPEFDEDINPFALKELGINIISYPWLSTDDNPGELEKYHKEGFVIFSLYKDNRYCHIMKEAGVNVNLVDILYLPNTTIGILWERLKKKYGVFLNRINSY